MIIYKCDVYVSWVAMTANLNLSLEIKKLPYNILSSRKHEKFPSYPAMMGNLSYEFNFWSFTSQT